MHTSDTDSRKPEKKQNSRTGTLYGIGVGPGAPDLLTLRAVNALHAADVVLAAASSKNDYSVALSIARPHLPPDVSVLQLPFPMTRDEDVLRKSWNENAETTIEIVRQGKNAAFLTLGDPLIYSTFGYLMQTVHTLAPELPVEVIPGITSFQAAAAYTRTILCEGEENLLLLAGVNDEEALNASVLAADNAVILKAYRNIAAIKQALRQSSLHDTACFVSRLGLDGEHVCSLPESPEHPGYLSLILATKQKKSR